jgi:hypothetical protein
MFFIQFDFAYLLVMLKFILNFIEIMIENLKYDDEFVIEFFDFTIDLNDMKKFDNWFDFFILILLNLWNVLYVKFRLNFLNFDWNFFSSIFIEFFVVNFCAKTLKIAKNTKTRKFAKDTKTRKFAKDTKTRKFAKNTKTRKFAKNTKTSKIVKNLKTRKIVKNTKIEKIEICEWRKNVQIVCFSIDKIEMFEKTSKNEICERKKKC